MDIYSGSLCFQECGDLYTWGWNECGQLGLPCPTLQHTSHRSQQQQQHRPQREANVGQPSEGKKDKAASLHLVPQCVDVVDVDCRHAEDVVLTAVACGTRHTAVLSGERGT